MSRRKEKFEKIIEALQRDLTAFRTGRASTALVETIEVEAYGGRMPLPHCATVTTPDPRTVVIAPWDKSLLGAVEKAIRESDLGLTPSNDGERVILPVPPLSEERRKEIAKAVRKRGEEAKVAIRGVRRQIREEVEESKRDGALSEDDARRELDAVQAETDEWVKEVDRIVAEKEKEILEF